MKDGPWALQGKIEREELQELLTFLGLAGVSVGSCDSQFLCLRGVLYTSPYILSLYTPLEPF